MGATALCGHTRGTAGTGGIYSSGSRALAVGVSWTSRTLTAPWAARRGHTTVVDAAGAIYVIGGYDGFTDYNDVWASTDGGARPDSVNRDGRWVLEGYLGGTQGYSGVV